MSERQAPRRRTLAFAAVTLVFCHALVSPHGLLRAWLETRKQSHAQGTSGVAD